MLALRKARAVAALLRSALVMGADQLGELDGRPLGKPTSREEARAQLGALLGRAHRLLTAVALVGRGDEQLALDVVTLRFHPVAAAELERYLDTGEWRGCAGGYRIEGRGQALVDAVEGDRTSVQGLPMLPLVRTAAGPRDSPALALRPTRTPARPAAPRRWSGRPRGPGAGPRA